MSIIEQAAEQRKELEAAVAQALDIASSSADAAEVTISKSTGISVSSRLQEVEKIEFNSDGALSITVYHQQRKGHALSSDLSEQAISRAVQAALDIARYTSPDPCAGPAEVEWLAMNAPDPDLFYPLEIDVEAAIKRAVEAEQYALAGDPRIINSEGGAFNSHYGVKVFGSSYGMLQSYCTSRHSLSCSVIAREESDMQRDYAYTIARDASELSSAQWVGEECARRVIARLQPRKLSTRQAPVLFAAEIASGLFGHLVAAISGGSLYRRSSFLLDQLGQQVLPQWLTITEQPHIAKGLASAPFDGEGVRTMRRNIVQEGVLQSYLLSSYTGRKLGMQTTGHAGGIRNWHIAGQGKNFQQLLREMDQGLLVTELLGQGVNIVTGDYSRGAAGFWVEKGEIQYPVSEITIAGNLREMLLNIATVGDDIETRSTIQCGSVLIPVMQIAGA